jgi:methionyl-tRNA synthetase
MITHFVALPPPCTNAGLHMGHLSGVFIPGDVYAKYMSLCGHHVLSVGGADQRNTYTEKKADFLNQNLQITQE